ncbi:hypothetical protein [Burkholderia sp. Bp8992]|uniref:hypothetical protein n=1 Tax=Burkholderia sp. Bp8992 TaxID=2184554 RepID=UPI000F55FDC5|nr:hypothetical protein [Burkholderia sp. Bp8992]
MATVRHVKPSKSFIFHTICNVYEKNPDAAFGGAGANALMERDSGFPGRCRQRTIESILKEFASRYSADCYRLLNAGRVSSQRTVGGASADA